MKKLLPPVRIYCEHGALTAELRELQRQGRVELIHFPYDPQSRGRRVKRTAAPSEAQWRDMNITWDEARDLAWNDFAGSEHLTKIQKILGPHSRRDALHVDSAYKSRCNIFITRDRGILRKRQQLEQLLFIRFFHPDEDWAALLSFIESVEANR